jgi:YD repeat-containing protein
MMIPAGDYRYEILRDGETIATEETRLLANAVSAIRRSGDGRTRHKLDATIGPEGSISRVAIRYASVLFNRNAVYEAADENLRGSVSAMAGRNEVIVKLGRFREIDPAGFALFRALTIAHVRTRGQPRWTGRVAVIDPGTLVAASIKQNCQMLDTAGALWAYEPRMGDTEELEFDGAGRLLRRRDNRRTETILVSFGPA